MEKIKVWGDEAGGFASSPCDLLRQDQQVSSREIVLGGIYISRLLKSYL